LEDPIGLFVGEPLCEIVVEMEPPVAVVVVPVTLYVVVVEDLVVVVVVEVLLSEPRTQVVEVAVVEDDTLS
jgi:hypothetical protein